MTLPFGWLAFRSAAAISSRAGRGGAQQARRVVDEGTDQVEAVGRDPAELDVSHMAFMALAADAAAARETLEALADEAGSTPEVIRRRVAVGTPDQVAAAMRAFVELGVNHFVCSLSRTPHPERFWERVELLASEVVPRVRG